MSLTQPSAAWEATLLTDITGKGTSKGVSVGQSCIVTESGIEGVYVCATAAASSSTWTLTIGGGGSTISTIDDSLLANVVSAYTFDTGDDLTDVAAAGNNYDLRSTTTETYITIEGKRALYSRENTRIDEDAGPGNSPNLQITGALTVYALLYDNDGRMNGTPYTPGFGASGETEATNFLYSFQKDSTGRIEIFWEQGGGGNVETALEYSGPVGRWYLLALTRNADGVTTSVYHNGELVQSFTASSAPSGGTSGELFIDDYMGYLGGIVVCSSEHSAGDVATVAAQVGVS